VGLSTSKSLESLTIESTLFTDQSAAAFSKALRRNRVLKELCIIDASLSGKAALNLINAAITLTLTLIGRLP